MLTIDLDETVAARVRAAAAARGEDLNHFAVAAILEAVERQESQKTNATRNKTLAQFIDEQRAKHGLPNDWPHAERYAMTEDDWAAMDAAYDEK